MHVWLDVSEIESGFGPSIVTIGNFDGVHLGHRHVLGRARELAAERGGLPVVAVTFDPHPLSVIAPDKAPRGLVPLERRLDLLGDAGADAVLVLRFTAELASVSPEQFVTTYLLDALNAAAVVVGENFRFGHRARGDVALLRRMGAEHNMIVDGLPLDRSAGGSESSSGEAWSSSYIRRRLAEGDVAAAAKALGRPFVIRGYVVRGEQRGRTLGYPTANVPVSASSTAVPADGVYAGWLRRLDEPPDTESADPTETDDRADDAETGGAYLPAAISVGTNPTFDGIERQVESYVLDRTDLELYDALVEVAFVEHLRGMVKFDSVDELVTQMKDDVARSRAMLTTQPT